MSNSGAGRPADRQAVRRAFDRAAATYDSVAAIQRLACHRLALLALAHPGPDGWALDAGCGTGAGLAPLAARYGRARCIGLDIAPAMLGMPGLAGGPRLCADMEALPLVAGSMAGVWSSLALQWCDADTACAEFARVLQPGGALWLATLGPETLAEVREAFATIDDAPHVIPFVEPAALVQRLARLGFGRISLVRERHPIYAPDLTSLLHAIKTLGASTVAGRRTRPLGKTAWGQVQAHYERFRTTLGLPATYDVAWITAYRSV